MDDAFKKVLDIYAIEAKKGENVILLPGYAHFLINPTATKTLITSNWSADNFESEYEQIRQYHGAAYYIFKGKNNKPEFVRNSAYKNVLRPKELPHFGLINNQPAYQTGQKNPDMLYFLNYPELYLKELTIEKCYSQ